MKTFDSQWEKVHAEREWGRYPPEEVVRFVARNYFNKKRSRVKILDLGCGGGAVSWFTAREGFNTTAVDGSESALKKASAFFNKEKLLVEFILSDLGELPFADNYFDAIIDSAAISANSTVAIQSILKECLRILKPNGRLFSTGLFKRSMTGFGKGVKIDDYTFRNIPNGPVANIGTVHFFDKNEINKLWEEAQFKDICIDSLERTDRGEKLKINYFITEAIKM